MFSELDNRSILLIRYFLLNRSGMLLLEINCTHLKVMRHLFIPCAHTRKRIFRYFNMHEMSPPLSSRAFHKIQTGVFCSTRIRTSILRQDYVSYKSTNTCTYSIEEPAATFCFQCISLKLTFL